MQNYWVNKICVIHKFNVNQKWDPYKQEINSSIPVRKWSKLKTKTLETDTKTIEMLMQ